jgi:hypothetical protein
MLSAIPHLLKLLTAMLVLLVLGFWFTAALHFSLSPDSGYYLPAARSILDGLTPYADFFTPYTPGGYYLFALLGENLLGNPVAAKALLYCVHLFNAGLIYAILRKFGHDRVLSAFFSAVFAAWIITLDGRDIVLEPFQSMFLLLGFLAAIYRSGMVAIGLSGIAVGCALMAKQTSFISVPVFLLIAAVPSWVSRDNPETETVSIAVKRLVLYGVALAVPFTLFCILTGQNFLQTFVKVASFGARLTGYVGAEYGLYDIVRVMLGGELQGQMLLPLIGIAALVLILDPTRLNLSLIGLAALNFLPIIFVRGYGHYIQLIAPWGVLLMAQLCLAIGKRFPSESWVSRVVALLVAIPILPAALLMVHLHRIEIHKFPIDHQIGLTNEIRQFVKDPRDVLVVGRQPWLYYLYYTAHLVPPKHDLSFVYTTKRLGKRIGGARFVIFAGDGLKDRDGIRALLEKPAFQGSLKPPLRTEMSNCFNGKT